MQNNELNFAKASLKFFLISITTVLIALLIGWLIILINGEFTLWAIVPLLIGLPITILVNITIAKKTIAQTKTVIDEGKQTNEKTE